MREVTQSAVGGSREKWDCLSRRVFRTAGWLLEPRRKTPPMAATGRRGRGATQFPNRTDVKKIYRGYLLPLPFLSMGEIKEAPIFHLNFCREKGTDHTREGGGRTSGTYFDWDKRGRREEALPSFVGGRKNSFHSLLLRLNEQGGGGDSSSSSSSSSAAAA